MIDMREPQNYHIQADPQDAAYSDEARLALEQALLVAEHIHPVSPDDIDMSRIEMKQDEMGRQLGRGVVESVVHQHEIVASQTESVATPGEIVEPMKAGIDVRPEALQAVCALLIGLRIREIQDSKVTTWND